jgi:hypothetical protein
MIIKRMARFIRQHDWSAVVVEIIVVIVGLMLAFQMDRWWEQRGEHAQEAQYVARLIADVEADVVALEHAVKLQTIRLDLADLLMAVVEDPEEATRRPVEFLGAVMQATFLYTPVPTMHTFEDLRSTGNMRLLRDPDLKNLLYGYYSYEANQRQFQAIWYGKHLRHQELGAGIVSHEQYKFIHDTWTYFGPEDIEEVRAAKYDLDSVRATVQRFLERRELIEWLPQTRVMQHEQIARNTALLDKATALRGVLQKYLESFKP